MKSIKRAFLGVILSLSVSGMTYAQSETYGPFRSDGGFIGALGAGELGGFGFGGYAEAKFNATDNISAGIRLEGVVVLGGKIHDAANNEFSMGMVTSAAQLIKGEYYLGTGGTRPFFGLGVGRYTNAAVSATSTGGASIGVGRHFGVAPQAGFNFGGFRLALTYNYVSGKDIVTMNAFETVEVSRSYWGIDIGFNIMGGKEQ